MKETGKSYKQILDFIARVMAGETPMIISKDYVVMSHKQYDKIMNTPDKEKGTK